MLPVLPAFGFCPDVFERWKLLQKSKTKNYSPYRKQINRYTQHSSPLLVVLNHRSHRKAIKKTKPHPSSEAEGAWLDRRKFYTGVALTSSDILISLLSLEDFIQKQKLHKYLIRKKPSIEINPQKCLQGMHSSTALKIISLPSWEHT